MAQALCLNYSSHSEYIYGKKFLRLDSTRLDSARILSSSNRYLVAVAVGMIGFALTFGSGLVRKAYATPGVWVLRACEYRVGLNIPDGCTWGTGEIICWACPFAGGCERFIAINIPGHACEGLVIVINSAGCKPCFIKDRPLPD